MSLSAEAALRSDSGVVLGMQAVFLQAVFVSGEAWINSAFPRNQKRVLLGLFFDEQHDKPGSVLNGHLS